MIKSILTVLSGDLIAKVLGLGITFILAKKLSVENFGIYNYIIILMGLLSIIVEPFANTYLRDHRYYQFENYNCSYIWVSICFAPLFYFIVYCFVHPLSWYVFVIFFVNFMLITASKNYFNVYELYNKFTTSNVLQQGAILISLTIVLFILKLNEVNLLIASAYATSSLFLILFIAHTVDSHKINFNINFHILKTIYGDSIYLVLYWSILPVMSFLGMFFIEKYINNYELGLYSFSLKIYALSLIGLAPMLTVLRIRQIDIARKSEFKTFFKRNIKKVTLFASGFYFVSVFGAFTLTYVFFQEYKLSITATIILISTSFFSYLTIPFSFLMAFRKYKIVFILSLISLLLNVGINYYFIPVYGIIAAASSNFIAHSFLNTMGAVLSYVYFNNEYQDSPALISHLE
jgi:O-antigen/teichoic acid export membrane protein